jgi:glutathione S-transferase
MPNSLHYYGAQGRGQQIRFALAEAGIEWEDEVAAYPPSAEVVQQWRDLGGNLTTNVPMLVLDGKAYTQSSAVMRVVARKGGLMPTDPELQYEVDNLIAACDDMRSPAYSIIFGAKEPEHVATFKAALTKHMSNFERLLGNKDWFVGDSCTVADVDVFDVCNNFSFNLLPSMKADFPKLSAFMTRFAERPNIKSYLASEKFTKLMAFGSCE